MENFNWIIHFVMGASDIEFITNCHTHGMELYDHTDFQVVINLPKEEIGRLLNTLGVRVRNGERFKAGDMVKGLYLDCDVRLDSVIETGRCVLRLVIPDKHNRFPEDPQCMAPYKHQTLKLFEEAGK